MVVIFFLSSRTGNELHKAFPFLSDFNIGHIIAYFILAFLVYYALNKTVQSKTVNRWNIAICLLYGITDEYHQSFVPTRNPDIGDLMRDMVGAVIAILVINYIKRYIKKIAKADKVKYS